MMKPVLTYETVKEDGDIKVYAVMNKDFLGAISRDKVFKEFSPEKGGYPVFVSGLPEASNNFALVVDADKSENAITEAIGVIQDQGIEVDIRTESIENRLGIGPDITSTARNIQDVLAHVEGWLRKGVFAPPPVAVPEFPE